MAGQQTQSWQESEQGAPPPSSGHPGAQAPFEAEVFSSAQPPPMIPARAGLAVT